MPKNHPASAQNTPPLDPNDPRNDRVRTNLNKPSFSDAQTLNRQPGFASASDPANPDIRDRVEPATHLASPHEKAGNPVPANPALINDGQPLAPAVQPGVPPVVTP